MNRSILIVLVWLISLTALLAQEEKGRGVASDSTASNYKNQDALGGPKTIGGQLKADNQEKQSFFRLPVKVTKPWYDLKKELNENTGLQLGINYTTVFMRSSGVIDEDVNDRNTGSGILDIQLGWNLVNRKSDKNKGTLFLKLNSRHAYGNYTTPMFHGIFESGYYGLPATGFNDYSMRILEFNWQQNLFDDRLTVVAGKVDVTNYFNFHGLIVPWTSFMGYGSSVSGTVNWPNQGIGALAGFKFSDNFYAIAGIADVFGDRFDKGEFLDFGDLFFKGKFFTALEAGYVPSMAERYFKKISITYWHTDSYIAPSGAQVASGSGAAFSANWFFQNRFAPYFRFGFSDGNGENAFYKKDLQLGHAFVFKSHDLLGTAFSIAEPNVPDADNQLTAEIFYRFQLTEYFAITPDFQMIFNPTFNPGENTITYIGIRGRVTL